MRYKNRFRVWPIMFIALLVVTAGIWSVRGVRAQQEEKTLEIGQQVEGSITETKFQEVYTFQAKQGDSVTFTMIGSAGLDSYLILEDDAGTKLAEDDDSAGAPDAKITFTFTKAGSYKLHATRAGQETGLSTGSYTLKAEATDAAAGTAAATRGATLSVTAAATAVATTAATLPATTAATSVAVVPTETVEATEEATQEATEEATSTTRPTATRTRTPRPTATVAEEEPTEEVAAEATETPTRRPTATRTRTPRPTATVAEEEPTEEEPTEESVEEATPTRRATATRTRTPRPTATVAEEEPTEEEPTEEPVEEATPTRRATATRRPPTRVPPTSAPTNNNGVVDRGPIASGDEVDGDIDDTQFLYVYSYRGQSGEKLTIRMTGSGGLVPSVAVVQAMSGNNLKNLRTVTGNRANAAITLEIALPADAAYFVLVTRAGAAQGTSSGSFTLTFTAGGGGGNSGGGGSSADEIDPAGNPPDVIARLVSQGVIPQGGRLLFNIPTNSFARASTPGLKYLPVGGGSAATNFVLNFRVAWASAGATSGCGMGFRRAGSQNSSFALLTNDGQAVLIQQEGQNSPINYAEKSNLFTPKAINVITVIAIGDQVNMYVNGKLQTTQTGKATRGTFELEMFNPRDNQVVTNCTFPSGWVWTLDR